MPFNSANEACANGNDFKTLLLSTSSFNGNSANFHCVFIICKKIIKIFTNIALFVKKIK